MEHNLKAYANIFDYFTSKYFFESYHFNTTYPNQRLSEVWAEIDFQIKRTFTLNQVLDVEYNDTTDSDFLTNLGFLADVDTYKHLDDLKKQEPSPYSPYQSLSKGSLAWKENFYNTLIRDTFEIVFDKLYTHVILHLNRKNYLDFDKSLLHLQFILNNSTAIKQLTNKEVSKHPGSSINFYINYFYGTLSEKNKRLVRKVVEFIHSAIEKRYACLYIDTDEIVIKHKKDIGDMLNFLGIPFKIIEISKIIIFNRKKLIKIYKDGQTTIRGFPEMSETQMKLLDLGE